MPVRSAFTPQAEGRAAPGNQDSQRNDNLVFKFSNFLSHFAWLDMVRLVRQELTNRLTNRLTNQGSVHRLVTEKYYSEGDLIEKQQIYSIISLIHNKNIPKSSSSKSIKQR